MNNPVTNSRVCLSFTNPPAIGDTFTHVSSAGNERWWKIHQLINNKIIAHSLDVDSAGRPLFTETYHRTVYNWR